MTADIGAVYVAGVAVTDPADRIRRYLDGHPRTVKRADFSAGLSDCLTADLISATRSPYLNSRISRQEGRWLLQEGLPDVSKIDSDACLADADPLVGGGLYDLADSAWRILTDFAPAGFSTAKASKVLYMLRPRLFPILDSRITRIYKSAAKATAQRLTAQRPEMFGGVTHLYWVAVQEDLHASRAGLDQLRTSLVRDSGIAHEAATRLSDVRLLDMLAW